MVLLCSFGSMLRKRRKAPLKNRGLRCFRQSCSGTVPCEELVLELGFILRPSGNCNWI